MIGKNKISGVVCEFNPLHNGHAALLSRISEEFGSDIVCVMSGNFVQRGEAAVLDKWSRTRLALQNGAALVLEQESPECGLGWNTLAGIGAVESHHGSIDESYLQANGYPSGRIIGVSLDGGQDIARIPDTDKGMFDGDSQWDRAVGPMQFIPSTWARWAADGNADGIEDPQHIDDAVLAAARYLCSAGGDMSVPDNWVAAVTSYNHSIDYNNRVAEQAQYYKELAEAGAETGAESETGAETGREG